MSKSLSHLSRAVDPRLSAHRWALALTATGAAIAGILGALAGDGVLDVAIGAVLAGISVFLAWAIARELDPDHPSSALAGPGLVLAALFVLPIESPLVGFWLLLSLRIVNRTGGRAASVLDSAAYCGIAVTLTLTWSWLIGLVSAGTLLIDGWLADRVGRHRVLAIAPMVAAIWVLLDPSAAARSAPGLLSAGILLLGVATFVPHVRTLGSLRSRDDRDGGPLCPRRVRAAAILAIVALLTLGLTSAAAALGALVPGWAGVTAVGSFHLLVPHRVDHATPRDQRH